MKGFNMTVVPIENCGQSKFTPSAFTPLESSLSEFMTLRYMSRHQKHNLEPDKTCRYVENINNENYIFNRDEYKVLIEEFDLTDDQKQDFLNAIWEITTAFVDFGFGIHPTQQISQFTVK
jgi:hypothetical protein